MNYFKETEKLLRKLPHKLQVLYAYNCAISVKDKLNPNDIASLECLQLTELWLKDSSLVNSQTLYDTAAYAAAYAAANAAAYATSAVAHAYASAAYATSAAAYATSAANADSKDKYSKHYYEMLISMINDITEVERLIYRIDL